jgi:diguanylate cyclase (GGDEF)-like protein
MNKATPADPPLRNLSALPTQTLDHAVDPRLLQAVLETLPDAVALFDQQLQLVLCNGRTLEFFPGAAPGEDAESVLRTGISAGPFGTAPVLENPGHWIDQHLQRLRDSADNCGDEYLLDGRRMRWSCHRDSELGVVILLSEVTDQRRAEERLLDALESIQGGVALWNAENRLVVCNGEYQDLFAGVDIRLVPGLLLHDLLRAAATSGRYVFEVGIDAWVRGRLAQHEAASGFSEEHLANGRIYLISQRRTADGGVVELHANITERKRREQELLRLSRTDPLTGANNRRYFMEMARREVRRAARYENPLAVLAMDLDHFKRVNDEFGHACGDAALRHFVKLVRATLREVDLLGRTGGEEFVALLPETAAEPAMIAAERVRRRLVESPLHHVDAVLNLSVSIGVAELHPGDRDVMASLHRADQALYQAKKGGRNCVILAGAQPGAAI